MTKTHIHKEDGKHNYMGHLLKKSIEIDYLMTDEALKLVSSKRVYGLIMPMYILNILVDLSI